MSDISNDDEGKIMLERLMEIAKQLNVSDEEIKGALDILKKMSRKNKQITLNTRIEESTNKLLRAFVESSGKSIAFTVNEALNEYFERRMN